MFRKYLLVLTAAMASCAAPVSWKYDALDAGSAQFDCARLQYLDPRSSSPLRFELSRIGYEIGAYLNLVQYRLSPHSSILVQLKYGDETYEEKIPVLEGKMRLRLSQEMTERLVAALQEGKQVKIAADGFEETLQSESFNPLYQRLVKNSQFLQNILKGSTEWTN